jgi:hypothetical protein
MTLHGSDKLTIVRFLWPLVATLAGCACTTRADLDRALPNFGQAAWPGGPH